MAAPLLDEYRLTIEHPPVMTTYILTLISAALIPSATYFAVRYRNINVYVRMGALALSAALVILLYFLFDDTTQIYGLGVLLIAFFFTLRDVNHHAEEQ